MNKKFSILLIIFICSLVGSVTANERLREIKESNEIRVLEGYIEITQEAIVKQTFELAMMEEFYEDTTAAKFFQNESAVDFITFSVNGGVALSAYALMKSLIKQSAYAASGRASIAVELGVMAVGLTQIAFFLDEEYILKNYMEVRENYILDLKSKGLSKFELESKIEEKSEEIKILQGLLIVKSEEVDQLRRQQ